MAEVVLPTGEAVELTTLNPEITAYITPVTFFPTGMAFEIVAELARPQRGQIMPYFVSTHFASQRASTRSGAGHRHRPTRRISRSGYRQMPSPVAWRRFGATPVRSTSMKASTAGLQRPTERWCRPSPSPRQ